MTNKKALGLQWYVLIVAFFLGFVAFLTGYLDVSKITGNYIGQYQFSIIKATNNAESTIFYIDQSAKYSLEQAIYDIAQNGGVARDAEITYSNKCRKLSRYAVWYELKKDESGNYVQSSCINEEIINKSLEHEFNRNLELYLRNYPYNIPINNYYYGLKDNLEVIGKAKTPLKFNILKEKTK